MKLTQVIPSLSLAAGVLAAPSITHQGDKIVELKRGEKVADRVLAPAIHWTVATKSDDNIKAATVQQHYYADKVVVDPSTKHHFGRSNVTYTIPAVNVDHADAVTLDKSDDTVTVKFSDASAYDAAVASWSGKEKLLLLTYAPICDDYASKKFCYVLATDLTFDPTTSSASAHGETVDGTDYLDKIDFEWGVYTPSTTTAFSSTNAKRDGKSTCSAKDSKYGLPIATPGDGFDKALDDCRGYSKASTFPWYSYAKSVGGDDESEGQLTVDNSKNLEGTLGLFNTKAAEAEAVAKAQAQASKTTRSLAARDLAKRGWLSWIPIKIPFVNSPISKDFNKDLSYSLPSDRGQDASPWGKAKLLYRKTGQKTSTGQTGKGSGSVTADGSISIYCVDCGASGSINIYGKGSYSLDSGLTEGFVQATVNVNIGLSIGMDIQATITAQANQQIATFGIPGLSFGIITIGPMITVGADFTFFANAEGKLRAGGQFQIINAKSTLDFVNSKNSGSSGWTPVFTPIFEASGQIAVGAEIGLPVAISVGIDIANGKFVKSVGLVERPSVEAKAEFAATANTQGAKVTVTDGCAGIATQVTFKNELYADILGNKFALMSPYSKVLTKGCIAIGAQAAASAFDAPTIAASISTTSPDFSGFNTTGSIEYTELVDATKQYFITTCPDSNIYMQPRTIQNDIANKSCTRTFESKKSSVVGDGFSRLFHYYADSMTAAGVSRLRVHRDNEMPVGTTFVNFYAFSNSTSGLQSDSDVDANSGSSRDYYVAQDSTGAKFYPALCSYSSASMTPKIFLIKDPVAGLQTLADPDLETSVTGGKISACFLIPVRKPAGEKGAAFDDDSTVNQGGEGASEGTSLDSDTDI